MFKAWLFFFKGLRTNRSIKTTFFETAKTTEKPDAMHLSDESQRSHFCLDSPKPMDRLIINSPVLEIDGWFFDSFGQTAQSIWIEKEGVCYPVEPVRREDVKKTYSFVVDLWCGFRARLPLSLEFEKIELLALHRSGRKELLVSFQAKWSGLVEDIESQVRFGFDQPIAERIVTDAFWIEISGWCFDRGGNVAQAVWLRSSQHQIRAERRIRPDVKKDYPKLKDLGCGFFLFVPLTEEEQRYSLEAELLDGTIYPLKTFSARRFNRKEQEEQYARWLLEEAKFKEQDYLATICRDNQLAVHPFFSILVFYDQRWNVEDVYRLLSTCFSQFYSHWELWLCPYGTGSVFSIQSLEHRWPGAKQKIHFLEKTSTKAEALYWVLPLVQGDYVLLLDPSVQISKEALFVFALTINRYPDLLMAFSDEDSMDKSGKRSDPIFKPGWNPELLRSNNYIGQAAIYNTKAVWDRLRISPSLEGQEEWDLALRIGSFDCDKNEVVHVPRILFHRCGSKQAVGRNDREDKQRLVLETDCSRRGKDGVTIKKTEEGWHLRYATGPLSPLVSIIIPTRLPLPYVQTCIESILSKSTYRNFEILLVINGHSSLDQQQNAFLSEYCNLKQLRLLWYDQPFNYAAINNWAAKEANGKLLAFLNDDVEVISPDWIEEMAGHALRKEVGIVGAKLYYPTLTIQSDGMILWKDYRRFHGMSRELPGYLGLAKLCQNLTGVITACALMRRELFERIEGFDEEFAYNWNDLDLCLRLKERGYWTVWTPFAELIHYCSVSVGRESINKQQEWEKEKELFEKKWKEKFPSDSFYNPNLSDSAPFYRLGTTPWDIKAWGKEKKG
ncbi:glycosyltransferase [Methylacidiphilum sp. Yel]|uniref:glycosyltransferase family 2 protein n=1 Tax=Methylacidiphilum sp. Yel TaxID=1847730 RepID=UPI0010698D87|nr:glycosyltransferase family 2 protein [Methylacidiphilum sp. Yel]